MNQRRELDYDPGAPRGLRFPAPRARRRTHANVGLKSGNVSISSYLLLSAGNFKREQPSCHSCFVRTRARSAAEQSAENSFFSSIASFFGVRSAPIQRGWDSCPIPDIERPIARAYTGHTGLPVVNFFSRLLISSGHG